MLWLLACQPGTPAESPAPAPAQPVLWRLGGRQGTVQQRIADAPPFSGAAELLRRCNGATPCTAELWRTDGGESFTVLRRGERLEWPEGSWPAAWQQLGTELTHCLGGDPLASPPGEDPGGFRLLSARSPPMGDREAQWVLHFSGQNACQLSGELLLSASRDRADSRALSSGGMMWTDGGREHALGLLRAHYEAIEAATSQPK